MANYSNPIYLDYAATTPVDQRVLEEMLPYFTTVFGNAASASHLHGEKAFKAVKKARRQVADLITAEEKEIIFTSGATEAINLALKGVYQAHKHKGNHIITVKTEHKAVLDTSGYLEQIGCEATYLGVDNNGLIDFGELIKAIKPSTILISIMVANNETGVIQDITRIGEICREKNILFFTDATQAFGKIPLDVLSSSIDLLCFSGHKIYGPKGIGGLFIKNGIKLLPQIHGGGHELGYRSGTLNVPAIVGIGKAAELAHEIMQSEALKLEGIRNDFENILVKANKIKVHGAGAQRLPHISNIEFIGKDADEFILQNMHTLSIALGSACTSNIIEPSHVLKSMHLNSEEINSSIRVSFGRNFNTPLTSILNLF